MARAAALTLAESWLVAIRDGRMSVRDASHYAELRVAEGGADPLMHSLAQCREERQLHQWVVKQEWRKVLPLPYGFKAPVKLPQGGVAMQTMHCLLPHEVFKALWEHAPLAAAELFGTPAERGAYWAGMERCAEELPEGHRAREHRHWLGRHPTNHADPSCRIPLGIHGDAGQMHGGEKITAVSWGGLCRKGTTEDTRLLFICLKHSQMVGGNATLYKAFEVLSWSMGCLATGVHPACDETGRQFDEDYCPERAALAGQPLFRGPDGRNLHGAWAELRGDWEFLRDALGLRHHYLAGNMCHFCNAQLAPGDGYYGADFTGHGPLRRTLVGPFCEGYNAWASRTPRSPLTTLPGFSIWRCQFDLMHVLELGILQRAIPAALQGLMGIKPGSSPQTVDLAGSAFCQSAEGRSRQGQCLAATKAYLQWAQRTMLPHSSRIKKISERWVRGAYPDVSQEHAKAAAMRAMLPWVAGVAEGQRTRMANDRVAALRATLLTELAKMDECYKGQPRFLSRAVEARAQAHCTAALEALRDLATSLPRGPFKLTPKCHALLHISWDSAMQNPRHAHCYQDEDFVGRTKRTYVRCHGATAPLRTIQRYALGTALLLTAREQLLRGERSPKRARLLKGGPLRALMLKQSAQSSTGAAAPCAAAAPSSSAAGVPGPDGPLPPPGPPMATGKRGRGRPPKVGCKRKVGRPRKQAADVRDVHS